ncbi:MAG: non-hydrolyzing UDP-N-acetylglucosamine 2-epimerase [Armatimonadota bacterium]
MKILHIVGTRSQIIKAGIVSHAAGGFADVTQVLAHTGQHYDRNMSGCFFDELHITPPRYNLRAASGSRAAHADRMQEALESVLRDERPDWVLLYGDSNSALFGVQAAVSQFIPSAHVEAGLRSFNRHMPEEINRLLTDQVADLLFAPTRTALANLSREGIPADRVAHVGDVLYDAVQFYGKRAETESTLLERLALSPRGYVMATAHRVANTDDPQRLQAIFDGLTVVARELPVVVPLHPRTRNALTQLCLLDNYRRQLTIIEPLGYLDLLHLEKHARVIATDSGGIQKEAFFHRVPCVTLRDETEWPELVELGWSLLVSPQSADAVAEGIRGAFNMRGADGDHLYGQGDAARRIIETLRTRLLTGYPTLP